MVIHSSVGDGTLGALSLASVYEPDSLAQGIFRHPDFIAFRYAVSRDRYVEVRFNHRTGTIQIIGREAVGTTLTEAEHVIHEEFVENLDSAYLKRDASNASAAAGQWAIDVLSRSSIIQDLQNDKADIDASNVRAISTWIDRWRSALRIRELPDVLITSVNPPFLKLEEGASFVVDFFVNDALLPLAIDILIGGVLIHGEQLSQNENSVEIVLDATEVASIVANAPTDAGVWYSLPLAFYPSGNRAESRIYATADLRFAVGAREGREYIDASFIKGSFDAVLGEDSVTSREIAGETILQENMGDNSVGESNLADDSVSLRAMQDNAVNEQVILDASIGANKIKDGVVGVGKLTTELLALINNAGSSGGAETFGFKGVLDDLDNATSNGVSYIGADTANQPNTSSGDRGVLFVVVLGQEIQQFFWDENGETHSRISANGGVSWGIWRPSFADFDIAVTSANSANRDGIYNLRTSNPIFNGGNQDNGVLIVHVSPSSQGVSSQTFISTVTGKVFIRPVSGISSQMAITWGDWVTDEAKDGISITWRGEHSDRVADNSVFAINDAVRQNGSSYICTTPHEATTETAPDSPTGSVRWDLMAQKGADGEDGGAFEMGTQPLDESSIETSSNAASLQDSGGGRSLGQGSIIVNSNSGTTTASTPSSVVFESTEEGDYIQFHGDSRNSLTLLQASSYEIAFQAIITQSNVANQDGVAITMRLALEVPGETEARVIDTDLQDINQRQQRYALHLNQIFNTPVANVRVRIEFFHTSERAIANSAGSIVLTDAHIAIGVRVGVKGDKGDAGSMAMLTPQQTRDLVGMNNIISNLTTALSAGDYAFNADVIDAPIPNMAGVVTIIINNGNISQRITMANGKEFYRERKAGNTAWSAYIALNPDAPAIPPQLSFTGFGNGFVVARDGFSGVISVLDGDGKTFNVDFDLAGVGALTKEFKTTSANHHEDVAFEISDANYLTLVADSSNKVVRAVMRVREAGVEVGHYPIDFWIGETNTDAYVSARNSRISPIGEGQRSIWEGYEVTNLSYTIGFDESGNDILLNRFTSFVFTPANITVPRFWDFISNTTNPSLVIEILFESPQREVFLFGSRYGNHSSDEVESSNVIALNSNLNSNLVFNVNAEGTRWLLYIPAIQTGFMRANLNLEFNIRIFYRS